LERSKRLPPGIVADATWPGMYRLVRPDGTLSDMTNFSRAREALRRASASQRGARPYADGSSAPTRGGRLKISPLADPGR
jgi:hypothetical protein